MPGGLKQNMPSVLILGATSGIGKAVAAEFARHHHDLILGGRDTTEISAQASDLSIRYGVQARVLAFDALAFESHEAVLNEAFSHATDGLEGAVLCIGDVGDLELAESSLAEVRRILDANFTGCVTALSVLANYFVARRRGFICAISSVAGDRGRQSNYIYCAAKGGLSVYLQGLRNRLYHSNVRVITIKPGFVDTPMVYGHPGLFLVASPESVARGIFKAIERGKDVVYLPGIWRGVMLAVRLIPESIFKRMRL